jgi:type I restriction enzyme, S subunit
MSTVYSQRSTTVGEICEFSYGKSLPARERRDGSVPVYGSNGIIGAHDIPLTTGPTIVIGRKGSVGEVHYSNQACWPIDTTYYVDTDSTEVHLSWLAYILKQLHLTEMNRAAAVPGLNRGDAYRLDIIVPSKEEQRRAARVLDIIAEMRATRRHTISMMHELLRSIFVGMFGDPVSGDSPFPRTPLGQLGQVVTGNTPSREVPTSTADSIPWVKSDNLGSSAFVRDAAEVVSRSASRKPRTVGKGSVLVTCIAGSTGSIGNSSIAGRDVAFNQQINAIVPHAAEPEFLLTQMQLSKRLIQSASTGGMKGMVSKGRLADIPMIRPPRSSQREFVERFWAVTHLVQTAERHGYRLDDLFSSLQTRAFKGEL